MTPRPPTTLGRRQVLLGAVAALPAIAVTTGRIAPSAAAAESAPPSTEDTERWLALRTRLDGEPVFWFARGTDYVIVDGAATPYNGRIIVVATRLVDSGGGAKALPYFETLGSVTPLNFEFATDHRHPITGDAISTAVSTVAVNLTLNADGRLVNDVTTAQGVRARYLGNIWTSPGHGRARIAASRLDIVLDRPGGERDTLAELNTLRPTNAGRLTRGFVAAESETTTTRSVSDPARYGGRTVWTVGSYHARKYRDVETMRRDMRPIEVERHAAFFAGWSSWAERAKAAGSRTAGA